MKVPLKKNWMIIVLVFILGGIAGSVLATTMNEKVLSDCKYATDKLQTQVAQYCAGTKLMQARITSVSCNEIEEICVCGDPRMLNGNMSK